MLGSATVALKLLQGVSDEELVLKEGVLRPAEQQSRPSIAHPKFGRRREISPKSPTEPQNALDTRYGSTNVAGQGTGYAKLVQIIRQKVPAAGRPKGHHSRHSCVL